MPQQKSHKELLPLIEKAKNELKKSQTYKDLCDKYHVNYDIIDLVPVAFEDLDVSAKTNQGCIYLNYKLLDNFDNNIHYFSHEMAHFFQQCMGDGTYGTNNADDYLDNPFEIDSFKTQSEYIAETDGKEHAENYIEKVLDHHDIDDSKRENKKEELLGKTAGLFTIPDSILSPIRAWLIETFSSRVLYDHYHKADSPFLTPEENEIEKDIIKIVSKYTSKMVPKIADKMTIPTMYFSSIDKFGIEPDNVYKLIDKNWWPTDISIYLFLDRTRIPKNYFQDDEIGRFNIKTKQIHLIINVHDVKSPGAFEYYLHELLLTIRHEIQHLYQGLILDINNISDSGLLSKKLREKSSLDPAKEVFKTIREINTLKQEEKLKSLYVQKEILKDIEFHTYLQDVVDRFIEEVKVYRFLGDVELTKEFAKSWIGEPNNFKNLYLKKRRITKENPDYSILEKAIDSISKPNILFETFKMYHPGKFKKAVKEFLKGIYL